MEADELMKKIKKYDKLAQKNYDFYQQSGEPRYDKNYEKYSELADVYRAAYKYQKDYDDAQSARLRNMSAYIEEHISNRNKSEYTKEEVLELAKNLKQYAI